MVTVINTTRSWPQRVCIGLGLVFIFLGFSGIIIPDLFRLHLSLIHNVLHLFLGSLALWCGFSEDKRKAYHYSLGFGVMFGLLGLGGFLFGVPGYPGVGYMEADRVLLRVIPNVLEFGTMDHLFHLVISSLFLVAVYSWFKKEQTPVIKTEIIERDNFEIEERSRLEPYLIKPDKKSDFEHRL